MQGYRVPHPNPNPICVALVLTGRVFDAAEAVAPEPTHPPTHHRHRPHLHHPPFTSSPPHAHTTWPPLPLTLATPPPPPRHLHRLSPGAARSRDAHRGGSTGGGAPPRTRDQREIARRDGRGQAADARYLHRGLRGGTLPSPGPDPKPKPKPKPNLVALTLSRRARCISRRRCSAGCSAAGTRSRSPPRASARRPPSCRASVRAARCGMPRRTPRRRRSSGPCWTGRSWTSTRQRTWQGSRRQRQRRRRHRAPRRKSSRPHSDVQYYSYCGSDVSLWQRLVFF